MKSVTLAVFSAVGLVLAGMPNAYAGSRPASKNYTPVSSKASMADQSGQHERKCMILSCGSRWCYNVRR